ncbi:ImpE family T6SS protein Cts1E [Cronobacter turicensis]|uniref:type VI secretion system accessory protein TagJ n=1 Tax=Cronobacter turicensis TaxID=413502 RepID=UPI0014126AFA|nr:type VI secretion system accessory protein TagJ [Cronobacter turicensis]NHV09498.1 ImpE family T6SS protein Cts1E [Cronobacter turicensis]NHV61617.1 ImpE family T6SS protein Cts1E [Cronobacter turicensis]NHW08558.1 ImpE family T6SS protein Cts1E [Cronobacter turicensis]
MEITLKELLNHAAFQTHLTEAISRVKAQPDNSAARELLFKLYCIEGDWHNALAQLEIVKLLDTEYTKRVELYKNLVMSELLRARVLAGDMAPVGLESQMPEWVALLHEANRRFTADEDAEAERLRQQAFEMAPLTPGDGVAPFSWIADGDGRLGPVCEFICAGGYRWVPFAALRELKILRPVDVLDLLWLPAQATLADGQFQGYIPARYPLMTDATQETKLGSLTDWQPISDSLWIGRGRKMLITDNAEYALPDIRELRFD